MILRDSGSFGSSKYPNKKRVGKMRKIIFSI